MLPFLLSLCPLRTNSSHLLALSTRSFHLSCLALGYLGPHLSLLLPLSAIFLASLLSDFSLLLAFTSPGKTTIEVVYIITTLSREQASPERLLELVRGHWSIENGSHYVRDVTFLEDRSRLRTGHAPQILAALRNLVITLIHRHGSSQIASTRRSLSSHPQLAFAWLLVPQVA